MDSPESCLSPGLLDNTGPQARSQVKAALDAVAELLGGLYVGRGDDDLGHARTVGLVLQDNPLEGR